MGKIGILKTGAQQSTGGMEFRYSISGTQWQERMIPLCPHLGTHLGHRKGWCKSEQENSKERSLLLYLKYYTTYNISVSFLAMIFYREEAASDCPREEPWEKKDCVVASPGRPHLVPPSRGVAVAQGWHLHRETLHQCPQQQLLRASDGIFCVVTLGKVGTACIVILPYLTTESFFQILPENLQNTI